MHRLVYLCDWLPPDFGAVGQYSLLFARERAAAGMDVVLGGLTSGPDEASEEAIGAGRLTVMRLHAESYDRADFRARAWWTLATNGRLLWRLRGALAEADEILFTGSPPFLLHFVTAANALLGKKLTYRITDFHPECLMAELGRMPAPLAALYRLTLALRQRVDSFEVLGEDQRRRLLEIGIAPERIELRRDPSPVAIPPGTEPLARPAELEGGLCLLYSGNFGVAHDHATFVEGYRRHHREGSGRVRLWLNATGKKADLVEAEVRALGLPVARSRPVALELLPSLLVTPDAHLITLRDELVGYVLPSKVYGCVESGRPVLFVGSRASDVDLLCRRGLPASHYRQAEVGRPEQVAEALEALVQTLGQGRELSGHGQNPAVPADPGKGLESQRTS